MKHCGILRVDLFHTAKIRKGIRRVIRLHGGNGGDTEAPRIAEKTLKGKVLDCKATYVLSVVVVRNYLRLCVRTILFQLCSFTRPDPQEDHDLQAQLYRRQEATFCRF